jgi:hypothetical protein
VELEVKINSHYYCAIYIIQWFDIDNGDFGGQDSLVDKALDYRPKGTGFDPHLDHKRRSTCATNSFSVWDNKDLLITFWHVIV